ncbi:ParB N-terminal domain-containing protein [Enterocloster sp. OA13]|uniref:ParB N-terminal domain-containing protein n=1 Tax=Enterocloster sp. OA13 TaxID=2914161 RepID=UPI00046F8744|nr:ParB N-terminal domain-containing protein [Enterocloster sp. OA13]
MGKPKINLSDFDDMLNFEQEQRTEEAAPAPVPAPRDSGIQEMNFDQMESFPNHKFKLYVGKQFDDMADSIRQYGILQPLLLWHTEDNHNYILSGHNRKECGKAAGLKEAPVIVKENLTHDDAVLIVIETNLRQRSFTDMSPSERAYCLFEHYKAMKSQGKRSDLILEIERLMNPHETDVSATSAEISRSSGSRAELAEKYSLTEDSVAKYIRVGEHLETPLMNFFDMSQFPLSVAYTLSFVVDNAKQQQIADLMESDSYKVDMKKAELLRSYYETGKLTDTAIVQILSGEKTRKPKSDKPQPVKVKPAVITKYFTPQQTAKEIEETIDKALAFYFENQESEMEVTA